MPAPLDRNPIDNQRSIAVETLGCKVNLFESQYIVSQLQAQPVADDSEENKNICIINTCTVTREADRQSRQTIRRAIRNHPEATIIVTGCYAELQPEACSSIPGVHYVVPGSKKLAIPQLVSGEISSQDLVSKPHSDAKAIMPERAISGFATRTRANLQIQQGCDNGCTFCVIHKARGESRSVPPTTVLRQVAQYVKEGFAEIVICGIDLGSYGEDLSDGESRRLNLAQLISEMASRYPDCRFRLSSIDPAHISAELIEAMESYPNICPHIHLSLQSAAPIILKRMKRRYDPGLVYDAVAALRKARPELILSADIMAGFPTESDDDFAMTRQAIFDLQIAYPHVFAYSERAGTPAARIPNQVLPEVRKVRARQLREAGVSVRNTVLERWQGHSEVALVEGPVNQTDSMYRSRLPNYLPVYFSSNEDLTGQSVELNLEGRYADGLMGTLCETH